MWLINTTSLELEYFVDPETDGVSYAILSHTWGQDEVSFQDFKNLQTASRKTGFAKIHKTCELARSQGFRYAWVDTCCIDKSSSAELSEAINSMFNWYQASAICYAYLSDVDGEPFQGLPAGFENLTKEGIAPYAKAVAATQFSRCRWFGRGWTLQELIAPSILDFYDASWSRISDKHSLCHVLKLITNINTSVLLDSTQLLTKSVWSRMSWAANRETTRTEDTAYSLLGLFDVNLPLIYGEGYKAFQRLQEEITRKEGDPSIFLWSSEELPLPKHRPSHYRDLTTTPLYTGAFAWAPSAFLSRQAHSKVAKRGSRYYWSHAAMPAKAEMGSQSSIVIRNAVVCDVQTRMTSIKRYLEFHTSKGVVQRRIIETVDGYVFGSESFLEPEGVKWKVVQPQETRFLGQQTATRLDKTRPRSVFLFSRVEFEGNLVDQVVWPPQRWDEAKRQWHYSDNDLLRLDRSDPVLLGLRICTLSVEPESSSESSQGRVEVAYAIGCHRAPDNEVDGQASRGTAGKLPHFFGICLIRGADRSGITGSSVFYEGLFDRKDLHHQLQWMHFYLKRNLPSHSGGNELAKLPSSDGQKIVKVKITYSHPENLEEAPFGNLSWTLDSKVKLRLSSGS